MAMRKLEDKNVRKLTRAGKTSLAVTIPVEIITSLGWKEKQKVVVKRIKGGLVIRDWRK
ncbi:AbrB/MazE/SpoVT family DNA-binding domain-containing protein [Patescibacteria group bacterium]|nr:AbrB/MazE/SpoVT family DNA-binding domain-containing protein [Patescibacteria group bacterium]